MCDLDPQLLAAFHDDELGAEERTRVEEHLRVCASCAAELRALRDVSRLIAAHERHAFEDLTADELARVHGAVDAATAGRPILRLGAAIGVIAASILIVSCAWLMELPQAGPGGGRGGATQQVRIIRSEPWEQVAMFRPTAMDPMNAGDDTTRVADARVAEWMLEGLGKSITGTSITGRSITGPDTTGNDER